MDRTWYVRLGMVIAVVLGAAYLLVPTFVYFSLPPEQRNDEDAVKAALPSWAPERHINLGLDLQGGVHLVLGVDLEKAVQDRVVRRADELRTWAQEKNLTFASIDADPATQEVKTTFASDADEEAFQKAATEWWQDMKVIGEADGVTWGFTDEWLSSFKTGALEQAVRTVRNRVDKWGVSEPTIAKRGENAILVQLPGFKDPEKAKDLLGRTAQLEFRIAADDEQSALASTLGELPQGITLGSDGYQQFLQSQDRAALDAFVEGKAPKGFVFMTGPLEIVQAKPGAVVTPTYRTYVLRDKVELTGDRLTDARPMLDQSQLGGGKPYVSLSFDQEGAREFERITGDNIQKRMAIVLDETVNSAPVIQSRIAGGNAQITLGGNRNYNQLLEEANELSLVLRSGALPAPVQIFEERTVGASLGPELVRKGTIAVVVGLVLVMIFMIVYYKVSGVIADVALGLNGVLILAAMALAGATLTLPGIAAFVLTLGMAVDANVLINERIREELRDGRAPRAAVANGYGKAFWTIFDANVTTLIAAFILLQYGTGPIRGFAVTLIIGLLASMFTAIVVTRVIFDAMIRGRSGEAVSI